jgi:hypothetical protein
MSFNPDKCQVISITNKKMIIDAKYTIHGQVLHETNRAKYIGVTIDNTLSWNSHIDIMTKKANNTTAFLRRNLSSCPADVKSACYKTLVRPQLEYAVTVWDPWTQTNISKIEAVQRREYASHSVTIEEQTVYQLCFTNLSETTSSPVDNNPKSPCYTELSINWSQYHQHLIYNQPV